MQSYRNLKNVTSSGGQSLLDDLIFQIENIKQASEEKSALAEYWNELFKSMAPHHSKAMKKELQDLIEAYNTGKKYHPSPLLRQCMHLVFFAQHDKERGRPCPPLQMSQQLAGAFISDPGPVVLLHQCFNCLCEYPRTGFDFCPLCGARPENRDIEFADPDAVRSSPDAARADARRPAI